MRKLLRVLDRIENAMAAGALVLLVCITVAVCLEVFMRYVLNSPLVWVVELSEYALLYICFLGTAWALKRGNHVRVDIFLWAFSPRWRRYFGIAASVFGIAIALILTIWGARATWIKYLEGAYNPTVVQFPDWIVLIVIPVGSLVLGLRFLRNLVEYATGERDDRPDYEAAGE